MKKVDWVAFRASIVTSIRYIPEAPLQAAYAVRYGNLIRSGSDTYELTERVLKEAQQDHRQGRLQRITKPS